MRNKQETKCKTCTNLIPYGGVGGKRKYCDGCASKYLTRQNLERRMAFNAHVSMSVDDLLRIGGYY